MGLILSKNWGEKMSYIGELKSSLREAEQLKKLYEEDLQTVIKIEAKIISAGDFEKEAQKKYYSAERILMANFSGQCASGHFSNMSRINKMGQIAVNVTGNTLDNTRDAKVYLKQKIKEEELEIAKLNRLIQEYEEEQRESSKTSSSTTSTSHGFKWGPAPSQGGGSKHTNMLN